MKSYILYILYTYNNIIFVPMSETINLMLYFRGLILRVQILVLGVYGLLLGV
jgi:hypothetical protein